METFKEMVVNNHELIFWIVAIAIVVGILFCPCDKEKDDSELHSKNRYKKTAELDEQLKNDDQIFMN